MCLPHLEQTALDNALAAVGPGSTIDLRGTTIAPDFLERLLVTLTPNEERAHPMIGGARFDDAQFIGRARFDGAQFIGSARFDRAQFIGDAGFDDARFDGDAVFNGAQFGGDARFDGAQFGESARFDGAEFVGDARFGVIRIEGDASFRGAQFGQAAVFIEAQFNGGAHFDEAQFDGDTERGLGSAEVFYPRSQRPYSRTGRYSGTLFFDAKFSKYAGFDEARFGRRACFSGANFSGEAGFNGAHFDKYAGFNRLQFGEYAGFNGARFNGEAEFEGALFGREAQFSGARFSEKATFDGTRFEGFWTGPLMCQGSFSAVGIALARAVRLQIAAVEVVLAGARFAAPTVLTVRFGTVDLTDMAADAPVTVASHSSPFRISGGEVMDDSQLPSGAQAKVGSLSGVDAANVVLSDVDLSRCVFSGAHHLDQIRLEGRCVFAAAPRGWQHGRTRFPARRWTRRKLLAEEAAWRADPARPALARAGWSNPGGMDHPVPVPSPAQLAVLYRQLRKALEDGKDAPGAADFYYGEMEARRRDDESTPRAERALLHAYWLLSGYALRASRALGFLAATAAVTFLLMLTIGLPDNQLAPQITGTQPAPGGRVALTQSTPDPALTLPLARRFTADRTDKAALVVVNSVIFRSTGATLTAPGTWIEIASRIGEPILLGFAAVAARGRVQR